MSCARRGRVRSISGAAQAILDRRVDMRDEQDDHSSGLPHVSRDASRERQCDLLGRRGQGVENTRYAHRQGQVQGHGQQIDHGRRAFSRLDKFLGLLCALALVFFRTILLTIQTLLIRHSIRAHRHLDSEVDKLEELLLFFFCTQLAGNGPCQYDP